jgi:hypothetical protein
MPHSPSRRLGPSGPDHPLALITMSHSRILKSHQTSNHDLYAGDYNNKHTKLPVASSPRQAAQRAWNTTCVKARASQIRPSTPNMSPVIPGASAVRSEDPAEGLAPWPPELLPPEPLPPEPSPPDPSASGSSLPDAPEPTEPPESPPPVPWSEPDPDPEPSLAQSPPPAVDSSLSMGPFVLPPLPPPPFWFWPAPSPYCPPPRSAVMRAVTNCATAETS